MLGSAGQALAKNLPLKFASQATVSAQCYSAVSNSSDSARRLDSAQQGKRKVPAHSHAELLHAELQDWEPSQSKLVQAVA